MRPAAARPAPCRRGRYRGAAGSRHRWQARQRRPWRARQRSPRHVRPSDRWCRSRRVLPWSGRRPVWLGDRLCCPAVVLAVWTVPGRWSAKAAEDISGDGDSRSRGTEIAVSIGSVTPVPERARHCSARSTQCMAQSNLGGSRKNGCPGRGREAPRHGGVGCRLEVNTTGSNKHSPSRNPATVCHGAQAAARSPPWRRGPAGWPPSPRPASRATLSAAVVVGEREDRGARAGDHRGDAVGPQPLHQCHALRHRRGAVLLVQPVLGGGQQQLGAPGQGLDEQCGAARVGGGVDMRNGARQQSARGLGEDRLSRYENHRNDGTGGVHPDRARRAALHPGEREAAEQTGRDVVGVALDLGGELQQRRRRRACCRRLSSRRARRRCRRRWRPTRSRGPGRAGCGWRRRSQGRAAVRRADRRRCAGNVRAGGSRRAGASRCPHLRCRCSARSRPPGRPRRRTAPATGRRRRSPGRGWRWWRGRAPGRRRRGTLDRPSLDDSP